MTRVKEMRVAVEGSLRAGLVRGAEAGLRLHEQRKRGTRGGEGQRGGGLGKATIYRPGGGSFLGGSQGGEGGRQSRKKMLQEKRKNDSERIKKRPGAAIRFRNRRKKRE